MKLTNNMRSHIVSAVLEKKVKPLKESFKKKATEKFLEYMQFKTKLFMKWIEQAPKEFLSFQSSFSIAVDDTWNNRLHVNLKEAAVVPFSWAKDCNGKVLIKEKEWNKIFTDLIKENKLIEKYESDLKIELNGVLKGCSTSNQLFKVFPEVSEYTDMTIFNAYPVMVQTDKLKRLLLED